MRFAGVLPGMLMGGVVVAGASLVLGREPLPGPARPAEGAPPAGEQEAGVSDAVRAALLVNHAGSDGPGASARGSRPEPIPEARVEKQHEPLTVQAECDRHRAHLESSGPAPAEFLARVRALELEWEGLVARAGGGLEMSAWRCYRAGCLMTASGKVGSNVEALSTPLIDSEGFRDWPGGKFRSGAIEGEGGRVRVMWALFAPEAEPEPADGSALSPEALSRSDETIEIGAQQ
jgi:hypothetical protein